MSNPKNTPPRERWRPSGDVEYTMSDQEPGEGLSCSDIAKQNVLEVLEFEDGSTQADLARALGWSRAQLSKVLKGDRPLRVDELLDLAWALSVAPASLMVPWSDEVALRVRLRGKSLRLDMAPAEAFRWVTGVLPPALSRTDHSRYMRLIPPGVQKQPDALNALREAHGVRVTDRGVEWLAPDGTVVLVESEGGVI